MTNNQTPITKHQINTKHQTTNHQTVKRNWRLMIGDSVLGVYLVIGIWCLVISLTSSCATGGTRVAREFPALANETTLKKAARELDRRMLGVRTFKGSGTLQGSWMGQTGTFQFVCAVRWPTDLRIELIDPAVGPVATLAMTDGVVEWFMPMENRLYRGEATPRTLASMARIPWTPAEVTGLLTGLPPMEYGDRFVDWWIGPEGNAISPDEQALLAFEGDRLPARYARFKDMNRRRLQAEVHFGDYRPVKGFLIPHELRLELAFPKTTMTVAYESVEINMPIGADVFTVQAPEETKVIPLK